MSRHHLARFILFVTFWSFGHPLMASLSCHSLFSKNTWGEFRALAFLRKVEREREIPVSIRSFIFEMSQGTSHFILFLPKMSVEVSLSYRGEILIISAQPYQGAQRRLPSYRLRDARLLAYALLKLGIRWKGRSQQVAEVLIEVSGFTSPEAQLQLESLGFITNEAQPGQKYLRL